MSTGVPSERLPNEALVMVGRCPDDDDAAAVSPNSPTVATARRRASARRTALPRIPVPAAVVYMDPPFGCPLWAWVATVRPLSIRRPTRRCAAPRRAPAAPAGRRRTTAPGHGRPRSPPAGRAPRGGRGGRSG